MKDTDRMYLCLSQERIIQFQVCVHDWWKCKYFGLLLRVGLCTRVCAHAFAGDSLSERVQQTDDQRRSFVDNHQHRQGGVHVLRRDGAGESTRDARSGGEQSECEWSLWKSPGFPALNVKKTTHFERYGGRSTTGKILILVFCFAAERRGRCCNVGVEWWKFHTEPQSLVWRSWSWDDVQVRAATLLSAAY